MIDITGAWTLNSFIRYKGDVPEPAFGTPPSGQIQYTPDGRMSAFLMDPAWPATGNLQPTPATEFYAYAGRWHLNGDKVHHFLEFSSLPNQVGREYTRTVKVIDDNTIELMTEPDISSSGKVYVSRLIWSRHTS
ncbi:MAG: lipocalin-like domain-containing protein [Pseudomonadota bacterium]